MRLRGWHVTSIASIFAVGAIAIDFINAYWPFRYRMFSAPAERSTDRQTENNLTEFSERAQAKKPGHGTDDPPSGADVDALSSLSGPVSIRDGFVSSQHLKFFVAGARANLQGTFNFDNQNVHLTGNVAMQSDVSHVTTGLKSFLLKPLAPFLRKKNAGAVVPIAVTGWIYPTAAFCLRRIR
jgi:AsmA-like C-terminal region